MSGTSCSVCGRSLPPNARGSIDATTGLMLGGWWRRVGATLADSLILVIPTLLVVSLFSQSNGAFLGALSGLVLQGLYMVRLLSGVRGQTVGNRVAATRVRDAANGHAITVTQALKRWGFIGVYSAIELTGTSTALYVVSLVALIDNLFPLFDPRNQTLHDKFAGTIVVVA